VRARAAWLVTVPLALAGVEVAHATANMLVGAPASEVFEDAASGRGSLGLVVGAFAAVVATALAGRVLGLWSESPRSRRVALTFAVLPPVAFVLLELAEESLSSGAFSWSWLGPTFAVGLALQLPVAAGAYLIARLLLRLSDGIRRRIHRNAPPRTRRPPVVVALVPRDDVRRQPPAPQTIRGRAPPLPSLTPS
jgi:hypothetical protein